MGGHVAVGLTEVATYPGQPDITPTAKLFAAVHLKHFAHVL